MLVAFDLDDTLYKEADFACSAYREIAALAEADFGLDPDGAFAAMAGALSRKENPFDALEAFAGRALPVAEWVRRYRIHRPTIALSDGVGALLDRLKVQGCRLAVVTDGRSLTQRNKIEALGLSRWIDGDNILISEETGADKTLPDNFVALERRYPGEQWVYVGDNPAKDFYHPNRRGWTTVCLADSGRNIHPQTATDAEHAAQFTIREPEELPAILEKIQKR